MPIDRRIPGDAPLAGALAMARRGLAFFPVKAGGARPLVADPTTAATADERVIRAWGRRWPNCHFRSLEPLSILTVLDPRDLDALPALPAATLAALREAPSASAPEGGRDHYFAGLAGVAFIELVHLQIRGAGSGDRPGVH